MKKLRNILTTFFLLLPTYSFAEEEFIGFIVASRGEAYNQDGEALSQGEHLHLNDIVTTGNRSFVVIQMTDGSKITVRPESEMKLDEYEFNGSEEDTANFDLIRGGLRIVTGSIAKSSPERYTVNTPVALMGVRGTEFSVLLCGDSVCTAE